jgi:SAM-dependent methyltransferase
MSEEKPEVIFEDPNDFYTLEETNRYETNSGMKKTQTELTNIILQLYFQERKEVDISILDVGCGTGFSLEFLKQNNFNKLIGIDPAKEMQTICKKKGFESYLGGFLEIPREIKDKRFDLIISVSALQWILTNKQEMEIKNIVKKIGSNFKSLLKENGIVILQYYPPTKDLHDTLISSFQRAGFNTSSYIYNEGNLKKQKYFLILKLKS